MKYSPCLHKKGIFAKKSGIFVVNESFNGEFLEWFGYLPLIPDNSLLNK